MPKFKVCAFLLGTFLLSALAHSAPIACESTACGLGRPMNDDRQLRLAHAQHEKGVAPPRETLSGQWTRGRNFRRRPGQDPFASLFFAQGASEGGSDRVTAKLAGRFQEAGIDFVGSELQFTIPATLGGTPYLSRFEFSCTWFPESIRHVKFHRADLVIPMPEPELLHCRVDFRADARDFADPVFASEYAGYIIAPTTYKAFSKIPL